MLAGIIEVKSACPKVTEQLRLANKERDGDGPKAATTFIELLSQDYRINCY